MKILLENIDTLFIVLVLRDNDCLIFYSNSIMYSSIDFIFQISLFYILR
jgi:hypothetical protein